MATMNEIEKLTEVYALARGNLAAAVEHLQARLDAVKREHLKDIRKCVALAKDAEAELRAVITGNKELFDKPRTVTLHGVKVGLQKAKGTVSWADEDAVIKRIRAQLPKDQAELLIRTEEHVHKPGVYDLAAADLKRLGIEIKGAGDVPVIKDTTGEVDKLVDALLKDQGDEA